MAEVVILPGLDGTAALLELFCSHVRALGVSARAIAYPTHEPLGYRELESLVRAQLPSEPFVLVGESFSGPLAVRIASNPPPGLVGLVLSTTFARSPVPWLGSVAGLIRFAPARPPISLLAWWLLGPWATPELKNSLRRALRSVSAATLRARAMEALCADVSALLSAINVPSLLLIAKEDRLLLISAAQELAAGLPNARSVSIAGSHLLLQTAPFECAKEVVAFASELDLNKA